MSSWLQNSPTPMIYITRHSPAMMEARFGQSFTDANGKPAPPSDWLYNPDVTAVTKTDGMMEPIKYWSETAAVVTLVGPVEKAVIDAAVETSRIRGLRAIAHDVPDDKTQASGVSSRALIEVFNKRDNYLVNRIEELQIALAAIKASTGPADNIRAAIPDSFLATSTRPRNLAIEDYQEEINSGGADS